MLGSANSKPVEPRFFNITSFDVVLVCHQCGEELDDDAISKFNDLKVEWKTVLPACPGKCSNAPNLGWVTRGVTKKTRKPTLKRKNAVSIDLRTFRPRPIESCFN